MGERRKRREENEGREGRENRGRGFILACTFSDFKPHTVK